MGKAGDASADLSASSPGLRGFRGCGDAIEVDMRVFRKIRSAAFSAAPACLAAAVLLAAVLPLVRCGGSSREASPSASGTAGTVDVVATLFPLYDFARQVGGDEVSVSLLLPPGVEAHSFDPSPGDVLKVSRARVFLYIGEAMEPWVGGFLRGVKNPRLIAVETSRGLELLHGHGGDHDHGEDGEAQGADPHVWLDPVNAAAMVDTVAAALGEAAPEKRELFRANAAAYKEKLRDLDERIVRAVKTFRIKTIPYGGHFAFSYFAKRYGLSHISPYPGFAPNAEPTPRRIVALAAKMKELGLQVIYHEELTEPRVARAVARETGARLLLLHGAHNVGKDDLARGLTYLDIMERNLENLEAGLR